MRSWVIHNSFEYLIPLLVAIVLVYVIIAKIVLLFFLPLQKQGVQGVLALVGHQAGLIYRNHIIHHFNRNFKGR